MSHCLLFDKSIKYNIAFGPTRSYQPCFFFTNKIPTLAEELNVHNPTSGTAVWFVVGNAAEAVHQLKQAASMAGVLAAIGMPDLHVGGGIPISAAIVTAVDTAYPQLVGSDIGCGMSFVETPIRQAN